MPELPEVQTTVLGLRKYVIGKKITNIWTEYKSDYHKGKDNIKDKGFFEFFKQHVIGTKIIGAERKAKNILIRLSNNHTILIHMKMTGHLMYGEYSFNKTWKPIKEGPLCDPFNRFIRLVFTLSNKHHLVLCDMRKFAKVTIFKSSTHLENIGPEPLDKNFTFSLFKKQIQKKPRGKIKTVLMDQSIIAGIGNIYSDEALWRSDIHPESITTNIPDDKLKKLYSAIKKVLNDGIDFGGDSMSDYRNILGERGKFQEKHRAYRKTKTICSKKGCGGIIERKIVGTRSAHFCSKHQKLF